MKKETRHLRADIINKSLAYIYKYIDSPISLDELAKLNSVSKYHFHRIFKEETNENVFDRITSIRLQKAANLLITNSYSTISEIAQMCGYSSHSSFIKAFKQKFTYTPTQWRKGNFHNFAQELFEVEDNFYETFKDMQANIIVAPKRYCAYIRQKGYDLASVSKPWERLLAFAYENDLNSATQIGIYHDNPVITHYKEGHYLAALEIDPAFQPLNSIGKVEIPESLCAVFYHEGSFGDVARLMIYIYHHWLPQSGYEAKTLPSYAIYHQNHCIKGNQRFKLDFYVPIAVV